MKLLKFLVGHAPSRLIVAIVAGVLCGACATGLVAIINEGLNSFQSPPRALLAGFIALCVLVPVTRFISQILLVQLGQRAILEMRMRLARQILTVPLRTLEEVGSHKLLVALTDDITGVTNALIIIPLVCINLAIVISCLVYLCWLSWAVFLTVVGFIAIIIPTYQLIIRRAVSSLRQAREVQDSLFKSLRALTDGIKELKLHRRRRRAFTDEVLETTARSLKEHNVSGMKIYSVASSWGQVLIFILVGLLLFALPSVKDVTAQVLTGYVLIILYMMAPLELVMNAAPALTRADIALNKVETLGLSLSAPPGESDAAGGEEPGRVWSRLELAGVTHSYRREGDDSSFVLGPLDLSFSPGELVFLIGGNGSGKTTLAKLLVGLYTPEEGEIRLDGRTVTDADRELYRQLFSVIFADFYLFDSLFGLDPVELDERARDYLERLQLSGQVSVERHALSTTTALSQGQRKRLALLTAYLEDRPFYIFDEWASDQDPFFRQIFYYQLLPELKARGKAVLVISHDDRYFHLADRIIKLDYGKVESDRTAEDARLAPEKHAI